MKMSKISMETKGPFCFFCLCQPPPPATRLRKASKKSQSQSPRTSDQSQEEGADGEPRSTYFEMFDIRKLQILLKYFKVDVKKIREGNNNVGTEATSLYSSVKLCPNCLKLLSNFVEVEYLLKVFNLEFQNCIRTINQQIKMNPARANDIQSDSDCEKKNPHNSVQNFMKGLMREELLKKSSEWLKNTWPKLILKKVTVVGISPPPAKKIKIESRSCEDSVTEVKSNKSVNQRHQQPCPKSRKRINPPTPPLSSESEDEEINDFPSSSENSPVATTSQFESVPVPETVTPVKTPSSLELQPLKSCLKSPISGRQPSISTPVGSRRGTHGTVRFSGVGVHSSDDADDNSASDDDDSSSDDDDSVSDDNDDEEVDLEDGVDDDDLFYAVNVPPPPSMILNGEEINNFDPPNPNGRRDPTLHQFSPNTLDLASEDVPITLPVKNNFVHNGLLSNYYKSLNPNLRRRSHKEQENPVLVLPADETYIDYLVKDTEPLDFQLPFDIWSHGVLRAKAITELYEEHQKKEKKENCKEIT